jgi:hypothetical protein
MEISIFWTPTLNTYPIYLQEHVKICRKFGVFFFAMFFLLFLTTYIKNPSPLQSIVGFLYTMSFGIFCYDYFYIVETHNDFNANFFALRAAFSYVSIPCVVILYAYQGIEKISTNEKIISSLILALITIHYLIMIFFTVKYDFDESKRISREKLHSQTHEPTSVSNDTANTTTTTTATIPNIYYPYNPYAEPSININIDIDIDQIVIKSS